MSNGKQINMRLQPKSWHLLQLEQLSEESGYSLGQIARDLLFAAIEQTSDNPPPRQQPLHLHRFDQGANR